MRCNICDRKLTDKEISFNKDLETYEPCTECLDVALDAAYSDGFKPEGSEDYHIIDLTFDSYDEERSIYTPTYFGDDYTEDA